MAKKSHKRSPRLRKDNSGCMWGLISMFDFRRGRSTPRFLSDKKRGSARSLGISYSKNKDLPCNAVGKDGDDAQNLVNLSDTEEEEPERVNLGVASIKILMEEEMSRAHYSSNESTSRIEWIKAELGLGITDENNHKEVTKNGMICSDDHANDSNTSPSLRSLHHPNLSDVLPSDLDLSAFMADCCSAGFQCKYDHLDCTNKIDQYFSPATFGNLQKTMLNNESMTILQKAIIDLTEAFLRQNSINSSKFDGNTEVQEKEFTNALEMLSSNKDLLLKLLQDPDSPILKHIQELQDVHIGKHSKPDHNRFLDVLPGSKELQKQSGHYFFRKRDKLVVANESNQGDDVKPLKRIVVLKPTNLRNQSPSNTISLISSSQSHCGPENKEDGGRVSSHFSFKEIKRRLRNAIGASRKERLPITMDGILHKIPYGKQITSGSETPCRGETIESGEKKSNTKETQKKNELAITSNIAGELKKLCKSATSQVLYKEATFNDEARKHLAELLRNGSEHESLPAFQLSKTLGRMLSFPGFNYLSPRLSPTSEKGSECPQANTSIVLCQPNQKIDKILSPSRYKGSFQNCDKCQDIENRSIEIIEVEECMKIKDSRQLEEQSVSFINEDDLPSETFKEEGSPMVQGPGQSEEWFRPSIPSTPIASSSAVMQEIRDTQCATGNVSRPSPISVLEPLYLEDVNSPASMIMDHAANNSERQTKPEEAQVDSSAAASGSIHSEANLITSREFDEASLFDELEISYSFLINDPKLLFDTIDEVLTEIRDRHFSCSPWVSFIRPNIRMLKKQDFMNESCKRINWNLDVQFPSTLEQAVKKDLYGGVWIELKFEAENTVSVIGNAILDYLFEETALELWH